MNRFKNEHIHLELPKGYKPRDFVTQLLRHFGLHLGGVFSLTPCKDDPLCCNPFHFRITANKSPKNRRHLKNQYQDIADLVEDIDWNLLRELGINAYLDLYNSREDIAESEYLQISRIELIQAIVLKTLELPMAERDSFWNAFAVVADKKLLRSLEKKLY